MKNSTIDSIYFAAMTTGYKIILLTPSGVAIGEPVDIELLNRLIKDNKNLTDEEVSSDEYVISGIVTQARTLRKETGDDNESSRGLWLKNIEISRNSLSGTNLPIMYFPLDQINGISLGELNDFSV